MTDSWVGLADAVKGIRAELEAATSEGDGKRIQFEVGQIELEFSVDVRKDAKADAGTRIWHRDDREVDAARDGWGGLSGAALFTGDLLTGVIIEISRNSANGRVEAVPVSKLAALAGFRGAVQKHTGHPMDMESAELSGVLSYPGAPPHVRSPASLLRAETAAVRFRGRAELLRQLERWCGSGGVSVRLITGPGGQGKTRLAAQFSARMRHLGWVTGWLAGQPSREERPYRAVTATCEPLLIVVEYAETRSEQLAELLVALREAPASIPVRGAAAGAVSRRVVGAAQQQCPRSPGAAVRRGHHVERPRT